MCDAGVGDIGIANIECAELGKLLNVFEAIVGESGAAEDKGFEVGQAGGNFQGGVADGGSVGQVEPFEGGGLRE